MTLHSRAETPQMTYEEVLAYRKYKYLPWCGVAYFDENTDRLPIGDERRMQAEYDVLFLNRHSRSNRNDKFLIWCFNYDSNSNNHFRVLHHNGVIYNGYSESW